jgi:Sedlin, N-terminal conserved region
MKIHQLYIEDLLNPFKEIGSSIASQRFDERVEKLVASFNQSDGMI